MKIDLGHGMYLEPDDGPRNTRFHRRIVKIEPIPGTRAGNNVIIDCGHRLQTFGDIEKHSGGVILCTECRDKEGKPMTISEAMRQVSDEYNAESLKAMEDPRFRQLMAEQIGREYAEIDKELPGYVSEIASVMKAGKPGERMPDWIYQATRMAFRMGMRVQRKLDQEGGETSIIAGQRHD